MLPGLVAIGGSGGIGLTGVVFLPGFSPADVSLVLYILFLFSTPYLHPGSPWGPPSTPVGLTQTLTPIMSHVDMREDGEWRGGYYCRIQWEGRGLKTDLMR